MAIEIFGRNGWIAVILLASLYLISGIFFLSHLIAETVLAGIGMIMGIYLAPVMISVVTILNMIDKKFDLLSVIATAVSIPGIAVAVYAFTFIFS